MVNYTLLCSNREMDIFLSKKDCIIFQIHFSDCLQTILFPQALSISIFYFLFEIHHINSSSQEKRDK